MRAVTDDEVAFFRDNGWVLLRNMVDPDTCREMLERGKSRMAGLMQATREDAAPADDAHATNRLPRAEDAASSATAHRQEGSPAARRHQDSGTRRDRRTRRSPDRVTHGARVSDTDGTNHTTTSKATVAANPKLLPHILDLIADTAP